LNETCRSYELRWRNLDPVLEQSVCKALLRYNRGLRSRESP